MSVSSMAFTDAVTSTEHGDHNVGEITIESMLLYKQLLPSIIHFFFSFFLSPSSTIFTKSLIHNSTEVIIYYHISLNVTKLQFTSYCFLNSPQKAHFNELPSIHQNHQKSKITNGNNNQVTVNWFSYTQSQLTTHKISKFHKAPRDADLKVKRRNKVELKQQTVINAVSPIIASMSGSGVEY